MIEYTVETIINRIQNACAKNDVTINKMGIESGAGKSAVDNIKKGSMPASDKLAKMADYLHCSVDYLLGREEQPKVSYSTQEKARLNDDEEKLLEIYRGLTETQKALVLDRAQGFSDLNEAEAKKDNVG